MPRALLAVLTLAYPALVYFGLAYFRPGAFGILIGLLVVLRLSGADRRQWRLLAIPFVLMVVYSVAVAVFDSELLVRIYPAIVNLMMLSVFGWSMINPPTFIERMIRARDMPMGPGAEIYLFYLSGVWCGFFVINAGIAAYTAWASSLETWALYNGLIVYLIIGILFLGEWPVRRYYKAHVARRQQSESPGD
jgi:uncharacterized membrane protein